MKKIVSAIVIMICLSSCGYRMGTHTMRTNLTAWKAEKQAKKEEKKDKIEKPTASRQDVLVRF